MSTASTEMEGRHNCRPVADQSDDEWLSAFEGTPFIEQSEAVITPATFDNNDVNPDIENVIYQYHGYSTRKDKRGVGRLVIEFTDQYTGEIIPSYFNVNIKYLRGDKKGQYFKTGNKGRFLVLPKSKFAAFWIRSFGQPDRLSKLYRKMNHLREYGFTGVIVKTETYTHLIDVRRAL